MKQIVCFICNKVGNGQIRQLPFDIYKNNPYFRANNEKLMFLIYRKMIIDDMKRGGHGRPSFYFPACVDCRQKLKLIAPKLSIFK